VTVQAVRSRKYLAAAAILVSAHEDCCLCFQVTGQVVRVGKFLAAAAMQVITFDAPALGGHWDVRDIGGSGVGDDWFRVRNAQFRGGGNWFQNT